MAKRRERARHRRRLARRREVETGSRTGERGDAALDGVGLEPPISQPVRHTDARGLAQSGAGEDDRSAALELCEPSWNLVGRDAQRSLERHGRVLEAPDVDESRSAAYESPGVVRTDPGGRAANGRGDMKAAG
jgi:hypothetical protein